MPTIDEKNHVINNANDELSRHLKRLDNVYPHIANEISEEARLGSLTHWAYENNKASTKATTQSARREAATSLAIMHDSEIANRSEVRREAVQAKKHRQAQLDSDFEIARAPVKRVNGSSKAKRVGELTAEASLGADGASHKKRKTERAPAAVPMERSASTMAKGGISMSRDPSMQENTKKRKAPVQNATVARKKYVLTTHYKLCTLTITTGSILLGSKARLQRLSYPLKWAHLARTLLVGAPHHPLCDRNRHE